MGIRSAVPLLVLLTAVLPAPAQDLRAFYRERCAVCHGEDGTGRGPGGVRLGPRSLADARWLARREDAALALSILKGRGAMPGFSRQLTEPEARRLVAEVIWPLAARKKR